MYPEYEVHAITNIFSELSVTYVLFELFGLVSDAKHPKLPEGVTLFDISCTYFSQLTWSVAHMLAVMDCSDRNMSSVRSLCDTTYCPAYHSHVDVFIYTVRCRYNAVNFRTNIHKRHLIACPLGRGMGSLLWIQHLGLALLTLSWDKKWDSHSLVNGYPSFYPRIALVAPSRDWYSASVPVIIYVLSSNIGPRYSALDCIYRHSWNCHHWLVITSQSSIWTSSPNHALNWILI